ncbi:MAG: glycosyltransferase [Candidatus Omnitrophica bacterium]|nr:glycosyltransferase [Candidatus Omnitrophota bacterium]
MKILQVIHDFLPKHQAGSELYCCHLSQALRARGCDVRLFYSEIDHESANYAMRQGVYDGLPFWEIVNNHAYASFEETYENPLIEKAFAECLDAFRPDIVHFHHLLGLSFGCVRLSKEKGVPVVFTLHDYWLTCPRGGGQRFRGEGEICHQVDESLCAECISRYSFGAQRGVRLIKRILSLFERKNPDSLLTRMQRGKISTLKRSFVARGRCDIDNDVREVLFAHPPTQIHFKQSIEEESELVFAIAMPPSVYSKEGDGVQFSIRCDGESIYERVLHPKQNQEDRGWHSERVPLKKYAGKNREFIFETQAYPNGKIDFCAACWAEPKLLSTKTAAYQPTIQSKFQNKTQLFLTRLQGKSLQRNVEARARRTREMFKQVDLFVAPSRFLRTKFIEYGLDPNRIVFSDYGILTKGYEFSRRQPVRPIRFTYIGTLVVHKGLHVLIEAFNRLPSNSAVLNVFGGTDEFTDYVRRIKDMIAHPGISLRGRADNKDIPRLLRETDVLVVPSIWFENSPITIHEAFLSRTPVITSRFGGMENLVQDRKNGLLFDLGDADSLYQCLLTCTENPEFILSMQPDPAEVKTIEADAEWMMKTYEKLRQSESVAQSLHKTL